MEELPLLSFTYLSSLAYLGGFFPSGSQSPRNTHSMQEEPHHASVSCCSPAKRKPDSKDGTAGRAPAQTGQAGLSPSGSRGGVSPVLSAVAGRGKCGRSIKPTPQGGRPHPSPPSCLPFPPPSCLLPPSNLFVIQASKASHFSKQGFSSCSDLEVPGWCSPRPQSQARGTEENGRQNAGQCSYSWDRDVQRTKTEEGEAGGSPKVQGCF